MAQAVENDPRIRYLPDRICRDIEIGEKEIRIEKAVAHGLIESSLYLTLNEQNVSDLLALKMAEIFAWQIDFYKDFNFNQSPV